MKKVRTAFIGLACLLVLVAVVARLSLETEPFYGGHTLSYWLRGYMPSGPGSYQQTEDAVRRIGTNALPWLMRWIVHEETGLHASWRAPVYRLHLNWDVKNLLLKDTKRVRADAAAFALGTLGPDAEPVIGDLARLMNDKAAPATSARAAYALIRIGPQALPHLMGVLTNKNAFPRYITVTWMRHLGTNARPALPALIQCLYDDSGRGIANAAADCLGDLRLEPGVVVPALTKALENTNTMAAPNIIRALGRFGADSRSAIPALLRALNDPPNPVRDCAINALLQIAPEVLTNAAVH